MKNNLIFAFIIAAMMIFAGCANESIDNAEPTKQDGQTHVIGASLGNQTKTHLEGLNMTWQAGDVVQVFGGTNYDEFREFTLATGAGNSSATFSSATGIPAATKYFAFYTPTTLPLSQGSVHSYIYFSLPSAQTYVANGIQDGIIPMAACGTDPANLQFKYAAGILRLNVYDTATTPTTIKEIKVTTNIPNSGSLYSQISDFETSTYPKGHISGNTNTVVTLDCDTDKTQDGVQGVQLSSNSTLPTQFNIVLAARAYGNIIVDIVPVEGETQRLIKTSTSIGNGEIRNFAAKDFSDIVVLSSDVSLIIDGNTTEPINLLTAITNGTSPTTSIKVLSAAAGNLVTDNDLEKLSIVILTATGRIDLDLSEISLSDNSIGTELASATSKIKSIVFPNTLTTIEGSAFRSFSELKNITLPESLITIGSHAFFTVPLESVTIPKNVATIGDFNFIYSKEIIVDAANSNYLSKDGVLFSKDGKTMIMYPGGSAATTYSIPASVVEGVDVEILGNYAMMNAFNLETLTIPATVKTIRSSAFQAMYKLATINCNAATPPALAGVTYQGLDTPNGANSCPGKNVVGDKIINVPLGSKAAYEGDRYPAPSTYYKGWWQFVYLGYVINDGSTPAPAVGTIGSLNDDNTNSSNNDFWSR